MFQDPATLAAAVCFIPKGKPGEISGFSDITGIIPLDLINKCARLLQYTISFSVLGVYFI